MALVAFTALTACGEDEIIQTELRAATFNAGLAPGFVPLVEPRAPQVIDAVGDLPVDALCVQELWRTQDLQAVLAQTEPRLPGAVVLPPLPVTPEPGTPPACTEDELEPLVDCAFDTCGNVPDDQLAGCVLGACGAAFAATGASCQQCLGASVGSGLEGALETCATTPGPLYAYGAAFGLALLFDGEMLDSDSLVLESTINRRAVLYAHVRFDIFGDVHLFCTHLTADLDALPFPAQGSWADEQRAQIDALLDFVDEKTGETEPALVFGDLNTGPFFGGVTAELPENYDRFVNAGFFNPYLESGPGLCTFCDDNPLVGGTAASVIIDHVLIRDMEVDLIEAQRIFVDPIVVTIGDTNLDTALSDHYGVWVALIKGVEPD